MLNNDKYEKGLDYMKKTVLFLILDQFADWETAYISSAIAPLGQGDYEVKTVSLTKDSVTSIGGFNVIPDYDIESAPEDYEALILIGGMTWRKENAQKVKILVDDCIKKGKVLAGICDACAFLAKSGVLNNVYHTSNSLDNIKQWAGDTYTGDEKYICSQAVSYNNIITANGSATLEFAKKVLIAINIASNDKINEWYDFHKLGQFAAPWPSY